MYQPYSYKGSSICGFCQNDAVYSRWSCLVDTRCKMDVHWCSTKRCELSIKRYFDVHNEEHHYSIDVK